MSGKKKRKALRKSVRRIERELDRALLAKAARAKPAVAGHAPARGVHRPAVASRPAPQARTAAEERALAAAAEDQAVAAYAERVLMGGGSQAMKAEAARVLSELGGPDELTLVAKARGGSR